jgi:hypothetical protein
MIRPVVQSTSKHLLPLSPLCVLPQLCRLHEHMKIVLNQVQAVERKMEAVKGSKVKVCECLSDIPVAGIT